MSPQAAVSPRSGNAWLRGAPTCALDTDEVASWCNGANCGGVMWEFPYK